MTTSIMIKIVEYPNLTVSLMIMLTATLTAKFCLYCWRKRRMWKLISKIPGPPVYPILGNSLEFLSSDLNKQFKLFVYYAQKYGSVVRLWFGPIPMVLLTNKTDIQNILHTKGLIRRGPFIRKVLEPTFLNGLFISEGEEWKIRRKIVQSTFHSNVFDQFITKFANNSEMLVERLKIHANGSAFEISNHFGLCVLDAIFQTAFAYNFDAQIDNRNDLIHKMTKALDKIAIRITNPLLLIDSYFNLTNHGREFAELNKFFQQEMSFLIDLRLRMYMAKGCKKVDVEDIDALKRDKPSLLDVMVASEKLSEFDMLGEMITVTGAGGESAGITCCYAICLLADHRDVQAKVFEEQKMVFSGDFYRPVTLEDLPHMTYLEQVIKETLRLFPPAPHVLRLVEEEVELEDGNVLPVGSYAYIFLYNSHRDPEFFPEPENFNPENFSPENSVGRNPFAYMPFGSGRRICVAYKYSMMEVKVILSTVLRRYDFLETVGGVRGIVDRLQYGLVLKPAGGFPVKFVPRELD